VKTPSDRYIHERFFGITRAYGSVKPMGRILSEFGERKCLPASTLFEVSSKYYKDPFTNFKILCASFKKKRIRLK